MAWIFRFAQIAFAIPFWLLSKFYFELEARGLENIKNIKGPVILASNHKSYIDHFLILAVLPQWIRSPIIPIRAMAGDGLYYIPVINLGLWFLGTYPARRGRGLGVSLAKPLKILNGGGVIGIFPEGGVFRQEDLLGNFRRGVGELSKISGAAVLPVAVRGTHDAFLRVFPKPFKKVCIGFGETFLPERSQSGEAIASMVKEVVFGLYRDLNDCRL